MRSQTRLSRMQQGPPDGASSRQRDSRVLVFSQRNLLQPLWHVTQYEFEDLVCRLDDVDLLAPVPATRLALGRAGRRIGNAASRRAGAQLRWTPWDLPQIPRTSVTADHDLFFAVFHYPFQLSYLRRLSGWRERSRRAACFIIEMWQEDLTRFNDFLQALVEFDVTYVLNPAMVGELRARGVNARFLPTGVDALTFSPLPHAAPRVIDCYTYGRRSEVTHRALVELAARQEVSYVYDTTTGGVVRDHREHRALLANLMKRSQFFFAYTINDSADRNADIEHNISTRYFEGAAGGAVMLGSRPDYREFDACFDWPDAVVPLPYECHDIGALLDDLRQQPERLARARYENIRNSLLRHDWSERWAAVLADNGLTPSPATADRSEELAKQAAMLNPEFL